MELTRIISLFTLFLSLLCVLPLARLSPEPEVCGASSNLQETSELLPRLITAYHGHSYADVYAEESSADQGGIKEDILSKYKSRYEKWKKEFLSTEMGRKEWSLYEQNPRFTLTIVISDDNAKGASTGEYKWDSAGQLIAARITLGSHIEEGVPNPIYYPVMNSLMLTKSTHGIDHDILAATKIAHEFGHVKRMAASMDSSLYRLQIQLIPLYNKIFLSNGRNVSDPRLLDLVRQIGGTPVGIWEDREYWGETNAMLYIRDKFDASLRCSLFSRIKHSVDLYAKGYEERFLEIAQSVPPSHRCAW